MSIVKHGQGVETVGISPKVAYPTLALLALGVVLCILDQLGVIDVEDEIWVTLLGAGGGVFGVGSQSPPPVLRPKVEKR